ncbi:MAG: sigma-70 family RNA polymerase sigma factor [Verrucomicrobiales bacterium]|nr:sigma-70 family RNA polymerase sigma factor [Verrucomicrobiales bacterium]
MNSAELLRHYLRTGDEQAFADLVQRHGGWVAGVVARRLGDPSAAEEVAQTVFIRLARKAPRFSHDAEMVAWLHRTALGAAVDYWRSEHRRRQREHRATMDPSQSNVPEMSEREVLPVLDEALDRLSDVDRQVVLLRFFEGRSMRDLGEALGISEDAAKMRVSRAVERLRDGFALMGLECSGGTLAKVLDQARDGAVFRVPVSALVRRINNEPGIGRALKNLPLVGWARRLTWGTALVAGFAAWWMSQARLRNDTSNLPAPVESTAAMATEPRLPTDGAGGQPSNVRTTLFRGRAGEGMDVPAYATLDVFDTATGNPVSGARVDAAYFFAGGNSEGETLLTDASGRVELKGPRQEGGQGANVFVTAPNHVPKVFRIQAAEARILRKRIDLEPGLTVGGQVVDATGTPVEGATICLERWEGTGISGNGMSFHHPAAITRSDTLGNWWNTFVPADQETIRVQISHPSFAVTLAELTSRGSESTHARIVLLPGYAMEGRVADSQGIPIIGARIREYHNFTYPTRSTETDSDGRYRLVGMGVNWTRPGTIDSPQKTMVVIEAEGYAPQSRAVSLDRPVLPCDITLVSGAAIQGRVIDEHGRPIPGVLVRTHADNQGLRPFIWMTRTDADGVFNWPHAPSGSVLFWFEAAGFEGRSNVPLVADAMVHEIRMSRSPASTP